MIAVHPQPDTRQLGGEIGVADFGHGPAEAAQPALKLMTGRQLAQRGGEAPSGGKRCRRCVVAPTADCLVTAVRGMIGARVAATIERSRNDAVIGQQAALLGGSD